MKKQITPPNRGYDAKILINDTEIGGQTNASLNQFVNVINITNQITGEWSKSMAGVKSWEVNCAGLKIKGAAAFDLMQSAFNTGKEVNIVLSDDNIKYSGKAIIVSFPIVSNYNDAYTYTVKFRGIGELVSENI